jgi:hypothetical protein
MKDAPYYIRSEVVKSKQTDISEESINQINSRK